MTARESPIGRHVRALAPGTLVTIVSVREALGEPPSHDLNLSIWSYLYRYCEVVRRGRRGGAGARNPTIWRRKTDRHNRESGPPRDSLDTA